MPVQEGEDEAVAEAHEPGDEQDGAVAHAAEELQEITVVELLTGIRAVGSLV